MCEHCDSVDALLAELNEGKRPFDGKVLAATLGQVRHVLDEILTDIDTGITPLHELLEQTAQTMRGMGTALVVNSRTVAHAARVEKDRLVALGLAAEGEIPAPPCQTTSAAGTKPNDAEKMRKHLVSRHGLTPDDVISLTSTQLTEQHARYHARRNTHEHVEGR